jgi:competence protein ComEA
MMCELRKVGARAAACALALVLVLAAAPALAGGEPQLSGTVNVNTATAEQLQLLPGIGDARARAVIETRKRRGGFERVEDLLEVKGIGESSLEQLRPYVTVKGRTTASAE